MPGDSGRGNSFGMEFVECPRKGFYHNILGVVRPAPPPVAPHVGTAAHAFFDTVFKGFDAGNKKDETRKFAFEEFEHVLDSADDGMDKTELENRAGKARMDILPVWFESAWDRLERRVEITIATEVGFEFWLPAYFEYMNPKFDFAPSKQIICQGGACTNLPAWATPEAYEAHKAVCLRRVTGRIDRVCKRSPDLTEELDAIMESLAPEAQRNGLSIQDFKTTSARSLKTYVADYLRSDQHLIYALGWNRATQYGGHVQSYPHPADNDLTMNKMADEILYSMVRIDPSIKAISAADFHDEPRLVQEKQLDDCYERLCAQRARLTWRWHEPAVMWEQNTSPSGPCNKFGHPCEYNQLCDQPGEWDKLIQPLEDRAAEVLDGKESDAYDYHLVPRPQPV